MDKAKQLAEALNGLLNAEDDDQNAWEAAKDALAAYEAKAQPVAWTLQETLDKRETTCSAHLWFTDPVNSAWVPLYTAPIAQPAAQPVPADEREALSLLRIARSVIGADWQTGGGEPLAGWCADVDKLLAASPQAAPVADHVADASKLVAPLRYVHLKRGTNGMCVVSLNGYEVIRDNGDVIDHMASPSWLGSYAAPQAAQTKAVADHIVGVNKLVGRPCTCHPSDNPPKPCSKHYALSECKAAHDRADAAPLTNTDVVEAWRTTDAARDDYGWTSCEWFQAGVRFAQRHYGIAATKESQP